VDRRGSRFRRTAQNAGIRAHGSAALISRRALLATPAILIGATKFDLRAIERDRVLRNAAAALDQKPITVTAASSSRSAGGPHDYFSEGDYWWPDPANPNGPYIQKDGLSNPNNFNAHREALIRLSVIVPALTAAWKLTGEGQYATHAAAHLHAWFVEPATRMSPHLLYAQAIQGRATGRGTGIIDTLHLVEVARSIELLGDALPSRVGVKQWFADYLRWMTTHKYGIDERDAKNNHATCWFLQAAAFARLTGNAEITELCRDRFRRVLLPDQMAADGSFPLELRRTKPYGYSLFNLDAMTSLAQVLSLSGDRAFEFKTEDGRSIEKGVTFLAPFIADKTKWPFAKDVMYWDNWPVRHPALLFAGVAYNRGEWLDLWKRLDPDPQVPEIIRNYPIRQPLLWL
jgi:hypothetical protein